MTSDGPRVLSLLKFASKGERSFLREASSRGMGEAHALDGPATALPCFVHRVVEVEVAVDVGFFSVPISVESDRVSHSRHSPIDGIADTISRMVGSLARGASAVDEGVTLSQISIVASWANPSACTQAWASSFVNLVPSSFESVASVGSIVGSGSLFSRIEVLRKLTVSDCERKSEIFTGESGKSGISTAEQNEA